MFPQVRLARLDGSLFLQLQCLCVQRVCVCACVPIITLHLLPEQGLSAVMMPSIAHLPWAIFFFLFGLQSYSKFAREVVEDGGWSECLWTVLD